MRGSNWLLSRCLSWHHGTAIYIYIFRIFADMKTFLLYDSVVNDMENPAMWYSMILMVYGVPRISDYLSL